MINKYGDIVDFMDIFAHIYILRRKRRGIQPKEIKLEIGKYAHKASILNSDLFLHSPTILLNPFRFKPCQLIITKILVTDFFEL